MNLQVNYVKVVKKDSSLIRKILAPQLKMIGAFSLKRTRAQWSQCILKIMFKFMFSEMAETNTKMC